MAYAGIRRPRRGLRLFVAITLSSATAGVALTQAMATAQAGQQAPAGHAPLSRVGRQLSADRSAMRTARATHRPVIVRSATTQTSMTVAKPNGTFAMSTHVLPVRVRVHGRWRAVSAELRGGPSRRWVPAAVPSGLSLSGGGGGPAAVLSSPAGGRVTLTFPGHLSKPLISGNTATYRSILPGVDLQLSATALGGLYATLLIGRSAPAASLRHIRLALRASGATVAAGRGGSLRITGRHGVTEFTVPSPLITAAARFGHPARHAGVVNPQLVPARYTAGALTLSPRPSQLRTRSRPGRITITINPATFTANGFTERGNQTGYTQVRSACPTDTTQWNNSVQYGNGVGYQDFQSDCNGGSTLYRALYQIDTSNLDPSMQVQNATLFMWENYAADWTCSDTTPLTVHWMNAIGTGTDWNNASIDSNDQAITHQVSPGPNPGNSTCTQQNPQYNVTYAIKQAAQGNGTTSWQNWTFGLYGNESQTSGNLGFMRIGDNPDIVTTFDLVPQVPTNPEFQPAPTDYPGGPADYGCNTGGSYGWINQRSVNLRVYLQANITNEQVRAMYNMWDNKNNGTGITNAAGPSSYYQGSTAPGETNTPINFTLLDGHQYGFNAQANVDGSEPGTTNGTDNSSTGYTSADSIGCRFNVDLTPPNAPSVTSTDFPPSGGTTTNGNSGTFTFSATDPVPPSGCSPSPCLSSGIYGYVYSLNGGTPQTTTSGSASITVGDWGTNVLQVQAIDNADNPSAPTYYNFYVPWNSGILPIPGDINGDGMPDLLAVLSQASGGGLNMYPGDITTSLPASVPASGNNESPDSGNDWYSYQITHRSSVVQSGGYDDLWVHKGANLQVYLNNPSDFGVNPYDNTANVRTPTSKPACSTTIRPGNCAGYDATDWSNVSQILAPGDAWAGTNNDGCGTSSLLTVEDDELWIYQGGCGPFLSSPVLLGSSGWSGMTLMAPGQIGGVLTLWARNNSTGALTSYTITIAADGLPVLSAPTTIPGITLTQSSYPVIASVGDNSTGTAPSLVFIGNSGSVWEYPGITGDTSGTSPLSTTKSQIGSVTAGSIIQLS